MTLDTALQPAQEAGRLQVQAVLELWVACVQPV